MKTETALGLGLVVSLLGVSAAVGLAVGTHVAEAKVQAAAAIAAAAEPTPAKALAIYICGKMYGIVVSDTKGGMEPVTAHSPGASTVLDVVRKLKPADRSVMVLEATCP